jgi:hypothetical protein
MIQLARVAKEWSVRPSQLLEMTGIEAWQLDLACTVVYWDWLRSLKPIGQ